MTFNFSFMIIEEHRRVLKIISKLPYCDTFGNLCTKSGLSYSCFGKVIKLLESHELIKCEKTGRCLKISITEKGMELADILDKAEQILKPDVHNSMPEVIA